MGLIHIARVLIFILPFIFMQYTIFPDRPRIPRYIVSLAVLLVSYTEALLFYTSPPTTLRWMLLSMAALFCCALLLAFGSYYSLTQCFFAVAIMKCFSDTNSLISSEFYLILKKTLNYNPTILYLQIVLACTIITLPLLYLFFKKLLLPALGFAGHLPFWHLIWIIPTCNNIIYYMTISIRPTANSLTPEDSSYMVPLTWAVLSFSTYAIILKMINANARNSELREQLHLSETLINSQQKQYELLQQQIADTARLRHDQRHHFLILQSLLAGRKYDSIGRYLNEFISDIDTCSAPAYCDNTIINAVVWHYAESAEKSGISTSVSIQLKGDVPFPGPDLCIVLGNLMENAVEACSRQPTGKKYINLKVCMQGQDALAIIIENTYNGIIHTNGDLFLSSKQKGCQGIGIVSVRNIASKYNGLSRFNYDRHIFQASVLLHSKTEGE